MNSKLTDLALTNWAENEVVATYLIMKNWEINCLVIRSTKYNRTTLIVWSTEVQNLQAVNMIELHFIHLAYPGASSLPPHSSVSDYSKYKDIITHLLLWYDHLLKLFNICRSWPVRAIEWTRSLSSKQILMCASARFKQSYYYPEIVSKMPDARLNVSFIASG